MNWAQTSDVTILLPWEFIPYYQHGGDAFYDSKSVKRYDYTYQKGGGGKHYDQPNLKLALCQAVNAKKRSISQALALWSRAN